MFSSHPPSCRAFRLGKKRPQRGWVAGAGPSFNAPARYRFSLLQRLDGKLQPDREWRMEVTDEFANPLYVLHINAEKPR
jgi:hypothetical protein